MLGSRGYDGVTPATMIGFEPSIRAEREKFERSMASDNRLSSTMAKARSAGFAEEKIASAGRL